MARAHIYRPMLDQQGNLLTDAKVTINESHVSVLLAQPIYPSADSATPLSNPMTVTDGILDIWLDTPQRVNIFVESSSDVAPASLILDAHPPAPEVMRTAFPLRIINQFSEGQVLVGSATPGEAQWADNTVETGLTPETTVYSQAFSAGADPAGYTWVGNTTPFLRDYSTDVPQGETFTRSLRLTQTAGASATARLEQVTPVTLGDRGRFGFWARMDPSDTTTRARVFLVESSGQTVRDWTFGDGSPSGWHYYEAELEASSYRLRVEYNLIPAGSWVGTSEDFYITGLEFGQGGQIPPHYHQGPQARSVLLGTSATVTGTDSVAVGDSASAALSAVAMGYDSTGAESAVAVGHQANAALQANALGAGAFALATSVAVGYQANVNSEGSVGVGASVSVLAGEAVAVGFGTSASGAGAVAVGAGAQARSISGVAVGYQALVDETHTNSVAIGSGAVTSAANQIVLGTDVHTVVVPGHLRALGNATVGAADSTVGFFGSAGITRPTLANPGSGNATLLALMEYLHDLGLIDLTGAT